MAVPRHAGVLQIIFAFNVLPSFGIILSGPVCAVLALGLHEAAYMTEIIRGGLAAVTAGQRDAARALGMAEWRVMRLVVLPQALRLVIPPIGNQFVGMLKLSALISVIGVRELLLAAEQAASGTFRYLEALSAAGLYYLAFTTLLMYLQHTLERRLGRHGRVLPDRVAAGAAARGPTDGASPVAARLFQVGVLEARLSRSYSFSFGADFACVSVWLFAISASVTSE